MGPSRPAEVRTLADPERFGAEPARMSRELTAHLAYEEWQLLPVLADVPWPQAKGPDTTP